MTVIPVELTLVAFTCVGSLGAGKKEADIILQSTRGYGTLAEYEFLIGGPNISIQRISSVVYKNCRNNILVTHCKM